jgi:hypothetical protein
MFNDILLRLLRVYIAKLRICKKCHILSKKTTDWFLMNACLGVGGVGEELGVGLEGGNKG